MLSTLQLSHIVGILNSINLNKISLHPGKVVDGYLINGGFLTEDDYRDRVAVANYFNIDIRMLDNAIEDGYLNIRYQMNITEDNRKKLELYLRLVE